MKKTSITSHVLSFAAIVAAVVLTPNLKAAPYATSLTNNSGVVSFRLNEGANAVAVIFTNLLGSTVVSNLGPRTVGLTTTNLFVPGNFTVSVTNSSGAGYLSGATLQITADGTNGTSTNTLRFNAPRGVAVNKDATSPYFGRIYVANGTGGTAVRPVQDGIYVLNGDYSDALGQGTNALTAGLKSFFTNAVPGSTDDGNTPWRLEVGQDNNLYIADFSLSNGCIYVTDPNVATGTNVIAGFGAPGAPNASPNHGRIGSSVIARGSLATSDLVIYAIDTDNTTTSDSRANHIMKWGIGAGPLPVDLAVGTQLTNVDDGTLLPDSGITEDLAMGPDGKFYTMQNRSAGAEGGIFVLDPTLDGSPFDPTPDGLWDEVYDSHADSLGSFGKTNDILALSRAVAISPDGNYMGIIRDDNQVWIIKLVSGIPDLTTRKLLTITSATTIGRDICFDAAGNLYTVSSGQAVMRAYSPGYKTVAQTSSQGTFNIANILPSSTVTVAASDNSASEPGGLGGDTGTFTFTRDGDVSQPLTVNYTVSGTATKGVDYVTNGASGAIPAINGIITFAGGQSTTNVTIDVIDDNLGEATETVIFTLTASTNYLTGGTGSDTVSILDDGDLPSITITNLGGSYELLPLRPAKFKLTTPLAYFSDLTINISLSGTAVSGVDYTNATSFTVLLKAGIVATNFTVTPYGNSISTSKTIVATVGTGTGYVLGTPIVATNILRADFLTPTTTLFADNFDTDTTSSWRTNAINVDNDATFNYDYSADGVPSAPHSSGATTRGLRLRSHLGALAPATAIGVSPIGQAFTNDFRLRFDLWMNYNGGLPGGGAGSSEFFTTGLGVSELRTNVAGQSAGTPIAAWGNAAGSAVFFEVDGDGGFAESTGDFIVYANNLAVTATDTNTYYAGARDNFNAYYAEFGEIPAPAAQLALFPNQTGLGQAGSLSFSWHDVVITKRGSLYSWTIDGLPIARTVYAPSTAGTNISFGYEDINTSITDTPRMNMALVDNVLVESLGSQVPVITSVILTNSGANVLITFTGDPADVPGSFTLQSSAVVNGPYSTVTATNSSTGSGTFQTIRPAAAAAQQFYRIAR